MKTLNVWDYRARYEYRPGKEQPQMKRFIMTVVVPITAVLALVGLTAIRASAQTETCLIGSNEACAVYYGADHAWNNWNGSTKADNPINFYNSISTKNSGWAVYEVGTVCDNESPCDSLWPFTDGSGLNARYNHDPVFEFTWYPNGSYCATQAEYSALDGQGPVVLNQCNTISTSDWFVQSGSDYLSPVAADNAQYAYNGTSQLPVLVGALDGPGNGDAVYMEANAGELQWSITPQ
jgi:hypothetical protein